VIDHNADLFRLERGHQLHQVALALVGAADLVDVGVEVQKGS